MMSYHVLLNLFNELGETSQVLLAVVMWYLLGDLLFLSYLPIDWAQNE